VGSTNATDLRVDQPLPPNEGGGYNKSGYDAFVTQLETALSMSVTGVLTLGTNQTYISAGNPAIFTYTLTNNGPDAATNIVVTDDLNTSSTGIPVTLVAAQISTGTCGFELLNQYERQLRADFAAIRIHRHRHHYGDAPRQAAATRATPAGEQAGPILRSFSMEERYRLSRRAILFWRRLRCRRKCRTIRCRFVQPISPSRRAGDTAPYQVQLTPNPLYSSNITLTCSNLPPASSCAFSPSATIALQSTSGATVALNIVTTARPVTTTPAALLLPRRFYAVWLMVPGLALVGVGLGRGRSRRIAGLMLFCWILSLVVLLPACGKTSTQAPVSGTPAGSYNPLVTATSGSDSKSQTVGLNVP
jgi:uncharacterized repeat protein (TIGR01451 family)